MIKRLRKTLRETSFMGMPIMAGADLGAFLSMTRSFKSLRHVTKRFGRHLFDLGVHGRAMQLVNGVALIARLAKSAEDLGVRLVDSAPAKRLILEGRAVRGAVVSTALGEIEIRATKGVVLAAGGFPNDVQRRKALFPRTPTGEEHLALPPNCCSGDGITLGESVGGSLVTDLASPVAWAPVSRVPYADGSTGHFRTSSIGPNPGSSACSPTASALSMRLMATTITPRRWLRRCPRARRWHRGSSATIVSSADTAWDSQSPSRCR